MKLVDNFPTHPKILKAAALLGGRPDDRARAIALYVAALGYARHHLTDGVVPDGFVASCGVCSDTTSVAKAFSNRSVKLWQKVKRGYRIHDFHDFNETAQELKQKRADERQRVAAWRARRGNGSA